MKYVVKETSYRSWVVEKEDGTEYYISTRQDLRLGPDRVDFLCTCPWNSRMRRPCRHINMVKEYLINGTTEFDL